MLLPLCHCGHPQCISSTYFRESRSFLSSVGTSYLQNFSQIWLKLVKAPSKKQKETREHPPQTMIFQAKFPQEIKLKKGAWQ